MKPTGPSHLEIYIIAAGVLLGIILGPAVLGRFAPQMYDEWFVGEIAAQKHRQAILDRMAQAPAVAQNLKDMKSVDISDVAMQEARQKYEAAVNKEFAAAGEAAAQFRERLTGRVTALVLAILAVMVIEAMLTQASSLAGRLTTVRYVLIAIWLALMMAQPGMLTRFPLGYATMLVCFAIAVSVIPLGRRQPPPA